MSDRGKPVIMREHKRRSRIGAAFYWLRYRVAEYSLRGFVAAFPWIPERLLFGFASLGEQLSFALLWRYRIRMEENLSTAMAEEFPTSAERKALVRKAWRNFARGFLETSRAMYLPKKEILSMVRLEGEDHLKRALAKKKGVIALSAHLGNFTMIGARLAAAGYPFSVLVKPPRDSGFARLIDDFRTRVGIKTISARPRKEAVRKILRALRENDVVLLIADEFKSGGVEVTFFGRAAPAPRGPAALALRTGAAVLPMFLTRGSDNHLTLSIGPEIELVDREAVEEGVAANTALFTRHLEVMIRRHPDQWNWLGFRKNGRRSESKIGLRETASADQTRRAIR
jgi:Kdo2-lipid IVA lauroyltransferase/acyltransferase